MPPSDPVQLHRSALQVPGVQNPLPVQMQVQAPGGLAKTQVVSVAQTQSAGQFEQSSPDSHTLLLQDAGEPPPVPPAPVEPPFPADPPVSIVPPVPPPAVPPVEIVPPAPLPPVAPDPPAPPLGNTTSGLPLSPPAPPLPGSASVSSKVTAP